jgi:hypothetical protein
MRSALEVCEEALREEGYEVARKGKTAPLGEALAVVDTEDATRQTVWVSEPEEAG